MPKNDFALRIRMGAAHYDLTTPDGQTVCLASLSKAERNKARRIVVGVFGKLTSQ